MASKNDRTKMILAAESRIPAWLSKGMNTIFVVLLWPCVLIGFIYIAVFFILNSSYGPKILHSQLSGFLRGDYSADTMATDAFLQKLTMTNVRLAEAGHEEYVIFAPKVEAKIPIVELVDLFNNEKCGPGKTTCTVLTVNRIKAFDADVILDFTRGELNILKVVLPYFSKPDIPDMSPVDPTAEGFVVHLADLNVENTKVHLIFDGFRIDLYDTAVDHFSLRTGEELEMISPMANTLRDKDSSYHEQGAVRVGHGELDFNPALFSFALASEGDEDEGLVMSGGPGSAGKVGYAYGQMAYYLEEILRGNTDPRLEEVSIHKEYIQYVRNSSEFLSKFGLPMKDIIRGNVVNLQSKEGKYKDYIKSIESLYINHRAALGSERDTRDHFIVPLKNTIVDGFNWYGDEFHIPEMTTEVGDEGRIHLVSGMMNVGPTEEEIEAHSAQYQHTRSGLRAQDSLLWAADLTLDLKVTDPILSYFFGPILDGDDPLELHAVMAGDLARVSGDISLEMPEMNTFDIDISRAALLAHMDGQHLSISDFEADTALGGVLLAGYYDIMDGNFNLDLWAGKAPEDPDFHFIDSDFRDRLNEGLTPIDALPDGSAQHFSGLLRSHLNAQSQDGLISLSLPEPIQYQLDNPYMGVKEAVIKPLSGEEMPILTWRNDIMTSPGGLEVELGTDRIKIGKGFRLNTNNLIDANVDVSVDVEHPANYAEQFGITDLESGPIHLSASYYPCKNESCGSFNLNASHISYMGFDVPKVNIELDLNESELTSTAFDIKTSFGTITANSLKAHVSPKTLADPMNLPFNTELTLSKIDFEKINIPFIKELGLKGTGSGRFVADGPVNSLKGRVIYTAENVQVMGLDMSRILFITRYEDRKVSIPAFNVWFVDSQMSDAEARKILTMSSKSRKAEEVEISGEAATSFGTEKISAAQAEQLVAKINTTNNGNGQARVQRRTPDLSLGAMTYYLDENRAEFNIQLQPITPNYFSQFKQLGIPLEKGTVAFDISANADIDMLMTFLNGSVDFSHIKDMNSTWVEGNFDLMDVHFAGLNLGNSQIQMSRSNQFALIRGGFLNDAFELSGFMRTSPRFSASLSLNFPALDVLKLLNDIGFDLQSLTEQFNIKQALLSGSIGFCMKNLEDMKVSLLLDEVSIDVLGDKLELTQTAFGQFDLNNLSGKLNQLELKYRDSVLKMSGGGSVKGDVDIDINGEVDAAIARSIPGLSGNVLKSSGLFGVSLSARGNLFDPAGKLSLDGVNVSGYLGVRDGIQVLTSVASSPIEMPQGFIIIERNSERCGTSTCLYTPEDQPFVLGIDDHTLKLNLFASTNGMVDASLDGRINVEIAKVFVKDISSATGTIELKAAASGQLFSLNHNSIDLTPYKLDYNGAILVSEAEPIDIELRSLSEPITVDQGAILITNGQDCPSGGECVVIPRNQAFKGELMGGNYIIFGEVTRQALSPRSADLSITANNVSFRMKDELSLTLSPDIQITVKDFSDFETIKVAGDIEVAEARYKKDFDDGTSNFIRDQILSLFIDSRRRVDTYSPSFLRKWPFLGKIGIDIGLSAENSISVDVKIAMAVLELELGAQLRVGGTIKDYAPTGIFSINQGVFTLGANDFEFQNGAQVAFNGSLDGKIDITATTEISTEASAFSSLTGNTDLDRRKRISTGESSSSDLYSITLTVGGSVFRPVWSFESSPYLSDTNVYALILTGRTIEDFSGNDVAMESLLSPFFSSQLDSFINADQFKFVLSEGAAQFVYVKQINKGLRIAAGVSIRGAAGNEQALSAEYYFNDKWFLDLTGQNTSDEEGRAPTFKLGVRSHWHVPIE